MQIAIPIYDRFTALDAIGPYEVLSRIPDATVTFVGHERGPVRTDNGMLGVLADATLEELPEPDIVLVPGGISTGEYLGDERLVGWIRRAHERSTYTTSVCSGSLLLGAAGVLDGLEATSHFSVLDALARFGATPVTRRWVEQGKVWTAAGVSAGIDMALALTARIAGDERAQAIQLVTEYDPAPPFSAGTLAGAPPAVREMVQARLARILS